MKTLFIFFIGLFFFWGVASAMSVKECEEKKGKVVNTLAGETCEGGKNLGEIEGLRCPCVCCALEEPKGSQWKEEKPKIEKGQSSKHRLQHKKIETH